MVEAMIATETQTQVQEQEGMSLDAFEAAYAEAPFELIDGTRKPLMAQKQAHGIVIKQLRKSLDAYLREKPLAEFFTEQTYALQQQGNWVRGSRQPDLMIYAIDRWQTYTAQLTEDGPLTLVPDWTIEVVSPNDLVIDVNRKLLLYGEDGVQLTWVIDPANGLVLMHDGDKLSAAYARETLSGAPVLPDYRVTIRDVLPPWFKG